MRRWQLAALVGYAFSAQHLPAQTSFDVLEQDLKEVKQKHDDAASEEFATFMSSLDAATQSGSVALELFKKSGGSLPDATPVRSHYEYETPSEKAIREAQDEANLAPVEALIQEHCGLMHFAALLTLTPKAPGVQDQWIAWLKAAAQNYPQLAGQAALKGVAMRDSVISKYLDFRGWGDSEDGKWSVNDLPGLYRDLVLEPLRKRPTQATLDAWDTYIAMKQADQLDKNTWTQEDDPPLEFDRDSDDFTMQPGMEKLSALMAIIKNNPTHSKLDDWIARMHVMIRIYRNGGTALAQSSLPAPNPSSPSSEAAGTPPAATPGTPSSAAAGTIPAATPGGASSAANGPIPGETPGTPSSAAAGTIPAATPGGSSSAAAGTMPAATPGASSSAAAGTMPAPTPGASSSAAAGTIPSATPGTPSSAAPGPIPAATPGGTSSAAPGTIPAATPGTPSSAAGGTAPTP